MSSSIPSWKGVNIFQVYFVTKKQTTMNRYFVFDEHLTKLDIEKQILERFSQIQEIKLIENWGPGLLPT